MNLTEQQKQALTSLKSWWGRRHVQQVFRVFGYAGTGKTTLIEAFLAEIGIRPQSIAAAEMGGAVFAAYTGKAAKNMERRGGVPAKTIHKLLYKPKAENEQEAQRIHAEMQELAGATDVGSRAHLAELQQEFDRLTALHFSVNPDATARHADVIVIDEVSMVGKKLGEDLLSLGRPVIVLGDPGQLPPIRDESGSDGGFFLGGQPDVMLSEIHRQAAESPIIRLSMMAREGRAIPFGSFGGDVWKLQKRSIEPHNLLAADQIICGMNSTRHAINTGAKRAAGLMAPYPEGVAGEKIICTRNNEALRLVNGQFLTLENVRPDLGKDGDIRFMAEIVTEDGDCTPPVKIYKGEYDDHVGYNKARVDDRERRDHFRSKNLIRSTWGWAITAHKAQGSQWGRVVVYDDGLYAFGGGRNDKARAQWLYTAITRAENGLVIAA